MTGPFSLWMCSFQSSKALIKRAYRAGCTSASVGFVFTQFQHILVTYHDRSLRDSFDLAVWRWRINNEHNSLLQIETIHTFVWSMGRWVTRRATFILPILNSWGLLMQSTLRTVWLSWTYEIFIDSASLWIDRLVGCSLLIWVSGNKHTHHRSDIHTNTHTTPEH